MATVNLGLIKFRWQGAYAGATAYVKDDVVSYNGSSYVCILASTGNLPTNTTYWNVMAEAGTDADIASISGLAQGDILYYNGTDWVRLGAGTNGQALLTGGTGANPSWGTISSGFVQLVHTQTTTGQTHASSSWTDLSGGSVTITPTSSSNKVYLNFGVHGYVTSANAGFRFQLLRGSTVVMSESDQKAFYVNGSSAQLYGRHPFAYLDSPSTTSATTYKIQVYTDGNSTVQFNTAGPSYITAMEVTP